MLFLLPHPFRIQAFPSFPLDAHDLARDLDISLRTAARIVDKKRKLKKHELIYLQMIHFGYVPEESFIRGKWFIRKGVLISYNHNLQIDINDANAYVVLRSNYSALLGELREAKARIKELERELALIVFDEKQTNIINFSDYLK